MNNNKTIVVYNKFIVIKQYNCNNVIIDVNNVNDVNNILNLFDDDNIKLNNHSDYLI